MDNNAALMEMLGRRRDRAISIVLKFKDKECDPHLPDQTRRKFRKIILDQMNDIADFAADVCRSLDTGEYTLNQIYIDKLNDIHKYVTEGVNGDD